MKINLFHPQENNFRRGNENTHGFNVDLVQ